MTLIWFIVTVLSVVVEAMTTALVAVWFMPGGLICLVLSLTDADPVLQVVLYFVIAAAMLILSRTWLKKYIQRGKPIPTNCDRLIGMEAVVLEKIDNVACTGKVKIMGQHWSARSTIDEVTFDKGDIVIVSAIEGVKLICTQKT